jgi:hypothetical protein
MSLLKMTEIPVFPLNTVLFPGCRLALQIFEQRYLDMIAARLKQDKGFVVVHISKGNEVGATPEIFSIGTYVDVVDWDQLENGLLGIVVEGKRRVRILDAQLQGDQLLVASIEQLPDRPLETCINAENLVVLLKSLQQHPAVEKLGFHADYENINSVIWCLCGLLPLGENEKQYLLEVDDPDMRLSALNKMLKALE